MGYRATNHNIIKGLEQANVQFPISRQEFMAKIAGVTIHTDYDKTVLLSEYCQDIQADRCDTKGHFFCLLNATKWGIDTIE